MGGSGVLNLLLGGLRAALQDLKEGCAEGFAKVEANTRAVDEVLAASNSVQRFVSVMVEQANGQHILLDDFHEAYNKFCAKHGIAAKPDQIASKLFNEAVSEVFNAHKGRLSVSVCGQIDSKYRPWCWKNIRLKPELVEIKTPSLTTKDQLQGQRNGHERVEAGLGKPEPGLGFNDGGVLVAQDPAVAGPDGEANEGVDAENDNTRQGAAGGDGMVEMADHFGEQEEGAAHHDQADGKADEVLEFADAVGKAMSGRLAEGQHRQVGSKHGEEIGALLEKVAEDGEGVGIPGGSGHKEDVAGAKGHAEQGIFFAGADGGGAHGRGWNGELKSG